MESKLQIAVNKQGSVWTWLDTGTIELCVVQIVNGNIRTAFIECSLEQALEGEFRAGDPINGRIARIESYLPIALNDTEAFKVDNNLYRADYYSINMDSDELLEDKLRLN